RRLHRRAARGLRGTLPRRRAGPGARAGRSRRRRAILGAPMTSPEPPSAQPARREPSSPRAAEPPIPDADSVPELGPSFGELALPPGVPRTRGTRVSLPLDDLRIALVTELFD